jgi:hypothetical protein
MAIVARRIGIGLDIDKQIFKVVLVQLCLFKLNLDVPPPLRLDHFPDHRRQPGFREFRVVGMYEEAHRLRAGEHLLKPPECRGGQRSSERIDIVAPPALHRLQLVIFSVASERRLELLDGAGAASIRIGGGRTGT